jgi:hypothetical protein
MFGTPRVNGNLAVSRTIGDYDYKKMDMVGKQDLVIAEPDITIFETV